MLELVLSDERLRVRFEAGYDGGRNGGSDAGPSLRRMRVLLKFLQALRRRDRAAITLERLGELVRRLEIRLVRGLTGSAITRLTVVSGGQEGNTFLDWSRMFGFGEIIPVEPEWQG